MKGKKLGGLLWGAKVAVIREVKIPQFRFTDTGDIHVPVPGNRGTTCHLRNSRYSGVRKPLNYK